MFNRKKVKELEAKISSMRKVEDVRDRMAYQLLKIIEKKKRTKESCGSADLRAGTRNQGLKQGTYRP